MVCTAGRAIVRSLDDCQDPTVLRVRAEAELLDDDIWIAAAAPSRHKSEDDLPERAAITRWSTVVLHPDHLEPLGLDPA